MIVFHMDFVRLLGARDKKYYKETLDLVHRASTNKSLVGKSTVDVMQDEFNISFQAAVARIAKCRKNELIEYDLERTETTNDHGMGKRIFKNTTFGEDVRQALKKLV